jgi:hypothetical protein
LKKLDKKVASADPVWIGQTHVGMWESRQSQLQNDSDRDCRQTAVAVSSSLLLSWYLWSLERENEALKADSFHKTALFFQRRSL